MSEPKEVASKDEEKSGDPPVEEKKEPNPPPKRKVVDYWEEGVLRNRIAEATDIVLPNVKELTKRFARGIEEFSPKPSPTPSVSSQGYVNGFAELKKERTSNPTKDGSKSNVAVSPSNSVTSRSNAAQTPDEPQTSESVEKPDKTEEETEKKPEAIKVSSSVTLAKTAGKEVHSLTARSISKEFREELKNNSSRRSLPKVDRGSSGESDHVEVVSETIRNRSPTPPVDLQSKRKFWEDIISNAQK